MTKINHLIEIKYKKFHVFLKALLFAFFLREGGLASRPVYYRELMIVLSCCIGKYYVGFSNNFNKCVDGKMTEETRILHFCCVKLCERKRH